MIAAVVLAAGRSQRMGAPKLALPWGKTTVIGQVVSVLREAGLAEVLVVTGDTGQEIKAALQGIPIRVAHNPDSSAGEMLSSCQVGLKELPEEVEAALIVLGDQPQIQGDVVRAVVSSYQKNKPDLVVPSYQMHRGHPWLVARRLWPAILSLRDPETLRDFLNQYRDRVTYVPV
jgi:molybdenum cofactor cytidylyltransferase